MHRSIVVILCIIALVQLGTSDAFCIKGVAIFKNSITNQEYGLPFQSCVYKLYTYTIFFGPPKEYFENSTQISTSTNQQETSTTNHLPSTEQKNSRGWLDDMRTSDIIWCSVAFASIIAAIILLIFVILDFRKIKSQQKQAIINKAKVLFKPKKSVPNQYVV